MTATVPPLPPHVRGLVDLVAALPDTIAVVLGGSQALGSAAAGSDWDLGLYYRRSIDLTALAARGTVHAPGSWGRLMNGGAWLRVEGDKVDVILRDLDVVEHWSRRAEEGAFEIDATLGYLAGMPTYTLMAELASCRVLSGTLPVVEFPPKLASSGPQIWRFCRSFSLDYARTYAERGNAVGTVGHAARAAMEEAHAVVCERQQWVCNEKRLLQMAGLDELQAIFNRSPTSSDLLAWVDSVADRLGVVKNEMAPWKPRESGD